MGAVFETQSEIFPNLITPNYIKGEIRTRLQSMSTRVGTIMGQILA